jgi:hypothetical protein
MIISGILLTPLKGSERMHKTAAILLPLGMTPFLKAPQSAKRFSCLKTPSSLQMPFAIGANDLIQNGHGLI